MESLKIVNDINQGLVDEEDTTNKKNDLWKEDFLENYCSRSFYLIYPTLFKNCFV